MNEHDLAYWNTADLIALVLMALYPVKHQYDSDAQTVISFLKTYGLDKDFKLSALKIHSEMEAQARTFACVAY